MFLARVTGSVVSTHKVASMKGQKPLLAGTSLNTGVVQGGGA